LNAKFPRRLSAQEIAPERRAGASQAAVVSSSQVTARIVVVSPDPAFTQPLVAGPLAEVATIEVHRTLDALGAGEPPAMCVVHAGGALARSPGELGSRLPDAPVIAVLPGADLATAVEVMQSSDRIAGVMTADPPDLRQLAALATRIVRDDVLGLEPVLAPGTEVHARTVADHTDKSRCLSEVAEFAERRGVPRTRCVSIEQCVDEMVMNALYDAPVDGRGQPLFAGIPTRARIALRTEHSALVRYACDGQQLAISVRDAFGRLDRPTVLRHLHKCLHAGQPIDRKVGGAGLGLYLMVNAASAVAFHVVPGVATEVLCVFDVEAPRLRLAQLGFVAQRDARGQPATGRARRLPAGPRRRARLLALAGVAGAAALGIAAWSLGPGRGDAPAPAATLELDSQPAGATAAVDGKAIGLTPLTLTTLAPGASVSIVFQRTGYRAATAHVQVPAAGQRTRVVQPLEIADGFVRVRFVSRPPGAEIRRTGQPAAIDRTYTPAELLVEADQVQRFTLVMPGHMPFVIPPFTPGRGADVLEKSGDLVAGATLHITATLDGKVTIAGAPHCAELALPADCTLAPGSYDLTYLGSDHAAFTRRVEMGDQAATEKLEIGIVEAAPGKQLGPSGAHRLVLEAGTHAVMVSDQAGVHRAIVQVQPGATVIAP
jgi:hypothetical protein